MAGCNHDCANCGDSNCESREIQKLQPHNGTSFKKTIAVMSGKGGVGKSLVSSLIAANLAKRGHKVALIDADVTGPSIPRAFGLAGKMAVSNGEALLPLVSKNGVKIMSSNCLLEEEDTPIVWKGPLVSGFVQQLYTDVSYGEIDYLVIDMPPGTADVPLVVFQYFPIDAAIVVSSPQDLVSMVVAKSINMAKMMDIKLLGVVENMASVLCPDCGKRIDIFGGEKFKEEIAKQGLDILAELPIDPKLAKLVDSGRVEEYETEELNLLLRTIEVA